MDGGLKQQAAAEPMEIGRLSRDLLAARHSLLILRDKLHELEESRLWRLFRRAAAVLTEYPQLRRGFRFFAVTAARLSRGGGDRPSADAALITEAGLFDAAWYRARNPDVGDGDPVQHYLHIGRHRLRATSKAALDAAEAARRSALGLGLPPPRRRIAIGFAPGGNAARALRSARIAADLAGLSDSCQLLWPGEAPAGAVPVDVAPGTSMAEAHNTMLRAADALGASLYLAADARGFFAPDSLAALLHMSAACGDRALIAATDFPQEHPRLPDPLTFRTGWAGGGCLLLPVAEVLRIGGFAPGLERLAAVDLSWRARQAGLDVKTCPTALYVGTPPAPGLEHWVSLDLLREGHLLAQLFGARQAEEAFAAELRRAGVTVAEPQPDGLVRDPAFTDWAHGFGFAPARW